MDTRILLEALEDPSVLERTASRRDALRGGGVLGAGLAMASIPALMTAFAKNAFAQSGGLPEDVIDTLNFALLLEYLEADFYNQGLAAAGLIPAAGRTVYQQIADHENAHVAFLKVVLGGEAIPKPIFDFTAGGTLDPFTNYQTFLLLSQAFEDTGVRAYKGQAPFLYQAGQSATLDLILTSALRIHSVEARHAAEVRRLRGLQSWIPFNQPGVPAAIQAVYAGEQNTVHAGIDAATLPTLTPMLNVSTEQVTEAFDEPFAVTDVFPIINQFGTGRLENLIPGLASRRVA